MTRVTQSMLSNSMLRNLNTSYGKLSKAQEQITSGRIISRASEDPVIATKGMAYRTELDKIEQYNRNLNEAYSWVGTTDTALSEVTNALNRVQELVTQAANDTNTPDERQKIAVEINQIREQLHDLGNTQIGGKYIFSGTHTQTPLFQSGQIADPTVKTGIMQPVKLEVASNVQLQLNVDGHTTFNEIDRMFEKLLNSDEGFANKSGTELGSALTDIQNSVNATLKVQSQVGANQNRIDLISNRLSIQEVNVTKRKSLNEDTDYTKAITDMTTQESIHQAALSVGAKIIQQTLVDFIK